MDEDDIFVFHGHPAGHLDKDGNVVDIVGLTGYDTLGYRDFISTSELSLFMAEKAPGIVIISGCAGYFDPLKQTFVDKGTKLYVGWSDTVRHLWAGLPIQVLLRNLFNGSSIQAALGAANKSSPVLNKVNESREERGLPRIELKAVVAEGGLEQTIYQLLGAEPLGGG